MLSLPNRRQRCQLRPSVDSSQSRDLREVPSALVAAGAAVVHRIIIGAPKKDEGGAVMVCDIFSEPGLTAPNACRKLPLYNNFENHENISDMWFGVSVSSGQQNGLMACAHRYVKHVTVFGKNPEAKRLGFGVCFKYDTHLEPEAARIPCDGKPYTDYHLSFGLCQAGTSCHLSSRYDIETMGSPGAKTWRGAVDAFFRRNTWIKEWVGSNTDVNYPVDNYAYLGMSVTTGQFFDTTRPAWAAGAPRANDTGAVLLFERNRAPNNNELERNRTLIGELSLAFASVVFTEVMVCCNVLPFREQVASSFGYVIAAVDINSDGLDDLVVGAPFYYEYGVGGAVYVYINEGPPRYIHQDMKPLKLVGLKEESRFGFAVAGLGDVDRDGYSDVAVGAPYEDQGAVYIYLGSKDGLSVKPSQIIRGSDIKRTHTISTTFGYSLSGGVDLDNNKYPDLIVGAYNADRAFAIYARPIKNIRAELKYILPIDPTASRCLSSSEVCTTFQVCLTTPTDFEHRAGELIIVQKIEAETFQPNKKRSRVIFSKAKDTPTPHILIERFSMTDYNKCTTAQLMLVDRFDIHNTVKLKLTLDLDNDLDRADHLRVLRIDQYPILNKKLGTLIINANFKKNCGDDELCESALHTEAHMNLPLEKGEPAYYLGSDTMNMTVSVRNTGESAYDAMLEVEHPAEVSFAGRVILNKKSVLDCSTVNDTLVRCDLGNPMENGDFTKLLLKFEPRRDVDGLNATLKFLVRTTTSSIDTREQEPFMFHINVVRAAELEIKGIAKPEQVWYGGKVVGASAMRSEAEIGSEVIHVYSVFNFGPYMVPMFEVNLRWPLEVENMRKNGKYLLYLLELPKVVVNGLTTSCQARKKNSIDPLNFTMFLNQFEPLRRPFRTISISRKVTTERNYTLTSRYSHNRMKRQIVPAESIRVDGRVLNVVTMKCGQNTRCVDFSCAVTNLKKHSHAVITIKARLWNATFVEDYPRVDQVSIFSSAEIGLDPLIDIRQKTDNDFAEAETKAYPDSSLYQRSEGVPWWVIALAVIIGILVLVIIAYCLYKIGFFKRNQHPRNGKYGLVSQTEKSELTQFDQYPDNHFH
ncbi:integrin alpha-PS1-like [Tropilaelaps mercedesae]|uniref:Integrin alpha-PS1-like n=1 Tax=Tropilaelaps mercedesae TaxID=418985 RepID=A0A1V9XJH4_9ACAR|nr:integrin alpha-PS1-like [Tropilaelaps mercedesae]